MGTDLPRSTAQIGAVVRRKSGRIVIRRRPPGELDEGGDMHASGQSRRRRPPASTLVRRRCRTASNDVVLGGWVAANPSRARRGSWPAHPSPGPARPGSARLSSAPRGLLHVTGERTSERSARTPIPAISGRSALVVQRPAEDGPAGGLRALVRPFDATSAAGVVFSGLVEPPTAGGAPAEPGRVCWVICRPHTGSVARDR